MPADDELAFLHPLPVRALWGVGPVTERRLLALGVTTVGELAALPPESPSSATSGWPPVGHLAELARGDRRPPGRARAGGQVDRPRGDVRHRPVGPRTICTATSSGWSTPRPPPCGGPDRPARTVTVKLRFGDFTQITRSHTLDGPLDATPAIGAVAAALLEASTCDRGVRLLGVSLSGLGATPVAGPSSASTSSRRGRPADGDRTGRDAARGCPDGRTGPTDAARGRPSGSSRPWGSVTAAVDAIRARYGGEAGRAGLPGHAGRASGSDAGARPSGASGHQRPGRAPGPDALRDPVSRIPERLSN